MVTGGSQGIGWGIADKIGRDGARVINGARKPPTKPFSCDIAYETLDVADEDSIAEFFNNVEKRYGGLDILVNNAGMMFQKHCLNTSVADWDRMMAVNLRGVFICSKHAVNLMMKNDGRTIINMGSIEGIASNPNNAPYAASKSGVQGLTRAIAVDMGQYGIRCNAVNPGWIVTPSVKDYLKQQRTEIESMKFYDLCTPQDV